MNASRVGRTVQLAGLLTALLLVGGCTSSATSAAPVSTNEVTMPKSYRFSPVVIQVPVGTTVTWHNEDNFTHSVKLLDGSAPDRHVSPGERTRITFSTAGEYPYECSLHPQNMRGKVIVTGS